jgi:hypothetical protein
MPMLWAYRNYCMKPLYNLKKKLDGCLSLLWHHLFVDQYQKDIKIFISK